jgi:VCBS repeat-containing protein
MPQDNKVHFKAHAQDDSATVTENGFVIIDARANDRGSPVETIFSLDQSDPTKAYDGGQTSLASGAIVQLNSRHTHVVYKAGNAFDYLQEGETATDSFTYTIQLADGSFSTATIDILVTGANDAAVLSDAFVRVTEGDSADDISTSGTLTISDPDSPELFIAGTQEGAYGTLTLEEDGDWFFTASGAHDELEEGQSYYDAFAVQSADGSYTFIQIEIVGTAEQPAMLTADPMAFL